MLSIFPWIYVYEIESLKHKCHKVAADYKKISDYSEVYYALCQRILQQTNKVLPLPIWATAKCEDWNMILSGNK
jgi:hypothetical protein